VADWHNHKAECDPNPEKGSKVLNVVKSYDQNVSLHVQNLFRQNEYGFARQAALIQHDITDCVCSIDIRNSPPVLKVNNMYTTKNKKVTSTSKGYQARSHITMKLITFLHYLAFSSAFFLQISHKLFPFFMLEQ
jgi:hypothetical protein